MANSRDSPLRWLVFKPVTDEDLRLLRRLVISKRQVAPSQAERHLEEECFFAPLRYISHEEAESWIDKLILE